MFLVDTNILSAGAPTKADPAPALNAWLRAADSRLYLATATIAEIEQGIARLDRIEAATRSDRLRNWLYAVERLYGNRILPFNLDVAHAAGPIMDRARGHAMGFGDIAIAATAAVHGLTVLTANERHFEPLGVEYRNPIKELPSL